MQNKFVVIIPFYNVSKTIKKTFNSVAIQDYDNYEAYFIDDMSTDNSNHVLSNLIRNHSKINLISNVEKKYSLKNIYDTVHNKTSDNDIIVILDGDDFFYGKSVFSILNERYNKFGCWLTYGSYINLSTKTRGKFSSKTPQHIIDSNSFREYKWSTSHLRTFKSFLFKSIKQHSLINEQGNFYSITGDLAIMFPMLEMAGNNSLYINELLYVWNDTNVLNDHKKNNKLQLEVEKKLRRSAKYEKLFK